MAISSGVGSCPKNKFLIEECLIRDKPEEMGIGKENLRYVNFHHLNLSAI